MRSDWKLGSYVGFQDRTNSMSESATLQWDSRNGDGHQHVTIAQDLTTFVRILALFESTGIVSDSASGSAKTSSKAGSPILPMSS